MIVFKKFTTIVFEKAFKNKNNIFIKCLNYQKNGIDFEYITLL